MIREAIGTELITIWGNSERLKKIFNNLDNFKLYFKKQRRSVFVNFENGKIMGNAVVGFWKEQKDTIAIWDLIDSPDEIDTWIKYLKAEASSCDATTVVIIDPRSEIVGKILKSDFVLFNSVLLLQCNQIPVCNFNEVARLKRTGREDFNTILKIDDRCFLKFWKVSNTDIRMMLDTAMRKVYVYIAYYNGRYAGYIIGGASKEEGNIGRIAVLPDFQRLGIGRQMLGTVLNEMRDDGIKNVSIHTQSDNVKAKALYKNFGFYEADQGFDIYRADV